MELTEAEGRALRQLVIWDEQWRWLRFVLLVLSFALIVVGIWESGQAAVAISLPAIGCVLLALTLGRWRGNPAHTLLIGILCREDGTRAEANRER